MTISWIFNTRNSLTIITLLATLLMSACSVEDIANAADIIADNLNSEELDIPDTSESESESEVETEPTPESAPEPDSSKDSTSVVAMYSYNVNLSNAQPLSGAVLDQKKVYMFFSNTAKYSKMRFNCCKGVAGVSTGEVHGAPVYDSSAPFVYSVDLNQFSTTGTRELYVRATRSSDNGLDIIYVNFTINITVAPPAPTVSEISLSWRAPFEREDDNPISPAEIAGYKIYYGTTEGDYTESIKINDGTIDSHTIKGLTPGTYYLVITTHDTDGRESGFSPAVTKTI